ncbi:MAG: formate dehydrogenase accessory sulfurtransferase FdhD [Gammaproteobacteria bacterium]|nr:formate dehydrogenase accessory sulfurtransferase FdhD [Gammaproteobacteria bacterium]
MWRWDGARHAADTDTLAEETAVCLCYNGTAHAVMLTTPADLEDFARGFTLTEGIVDAPAEISALAVQAEPDRVTIDITVPEVRRTRIEQRRRSLEGRSGCGQCGIAELDAVLRQPPPLPQTLTVTPAALHRAIAALTADQPLGSSTGTLHAAAWAARDGSILLVREDVGRHNALDKVIGALLQRPATLASGFLLLTSRASHELVLKCAIAGIELVAAVSGATGLAARLAAACNLTLVGFTRTGRHVVYSCPARLEARQP